MGRNPDANLPVLPWGALVPVPCVSLLLALPGANLPAFMTWSRCGSSRICTSSPNHNPFGATYYTALFHLRNISPCSISKTVCLSSLSSRYGPKTSPPSIPAVALLPASPLSKLKTWTPTSDFSFEPCDQTPSLTSYHFNSLKFVCLPLSSLTTHVCPAEGAPSSPTSYFVT